jgi:hypothetical protein
MDANVSEEHIASLIKALTYPTAVRHQPDDHNKKINFSVSYRKVLRHEESYSRE